MKGKKTAGEPGGIGIQNDQYRYLRRLSSRDEARAAVQKRAASLERLLAACEQRLDGAPEGSLRVVKRGAKSLFFERTPHGSANGRYINRTEMDKAAALSQKDYDRRLQKAARTELEALRKIEGLWPERTVEDVYGSLNPRVRELACPAALDNGQLAALWQEKPYPRMAPPEEEKGYRTDGGEYVRSKSELTIANMLFRSGVPYRYEEEIAVGSLTLRPDFTVLNVQAGRTFYWEHFGLMSDAEYSRNALRKIQAYEEAGIFPGEGLLVTFESEELPLNTALVQKTIQKYLL